MPRLRYVQVEPLGHLPQIVRRAASESIARVNARPQTSVQGALREPPRAADTAGADEHHATPSKGAAS